MKLRGRIAVSFMVVMIIPLILINVAFFTIIKTRFSLIGDNAEVKTNSIITSISNPISYISRIIAVDYSELLANLNTNPERLEDKEYLDNFSQRIIKKYSYIYVLKGDKLIYGKNMELYKMHPLHFPQDGCLL